MKKIMSFFVLLALAFAPNAQALEKTTVEIMTLPFGTASYASDMALESLFKELDTPVTFMLKQTPGAMYIYRYRIENEKKIREGKVPYYIGLTMASILPYVAKGLPPYEKMAAPDQRILGITGGVASPFITLNPNIKTVKDLVGKKVGFAEKSRPNMSTLPNKPVFDYAYGGFDKVNWQYLGTANSKDALMNGSIDVHQGQGTIAVKVDKNGNFYADKFNLDPALMEITSSGRAYNFVDEDPEVLRKAYNPDKDIVSVPILLKAGSIPGYNKDVWAKGNFTCYEIDKDAPDELVAEIVYQMWKNKARLATYYEGFSTMTDSPYVEGIDINLYHPGVFIAMKRLGLPLPKGVTVN